MHLDPCKQIWHVHPLFECFWTQNNNCDNKCGWSGLEEWIDNIVIGDPMNESMNQQSVDLRSICHDYSDLCFWFLVNVISHKKLDRLSSSLAQIPGPEDGQILDFCADISKITVMWHILVIAAEFICYFWQKLRSIRITTVNSSRLWPKDHKSASLWHHNIH